MAVNFNQPSLAMFFQLLNEENNTAFNSSIVDLSAPSPMTGTRNTAITVTAKVASGYSGSVNLTYNRLDLTVFTDGNTEFTLNGISTTEDLLPAINARFGLQMAVTDIIVEAVVNGAVNLKARSTSLVWVGNVDITIIQPDIELDTVIVDTELDGFEYPV